jgi:IS1 family transposase
LDTIHFALKCCCEVAHADRFVLVCPPVRCGVGLADLGSSAPRAPPGPPPTVSVTVQRLLKPRTPYHCPACCQQAAAPSGHPPAHPPLTPWRAIKSRRGAPKRIDTQGFACPNRTCAFYQITGAQIHALVGDGADGWRERIQTFRCQACNATFSARRATPLYRLKTPSQRVGEVLTALAEGLAVAAAVRVFGHRHATITTWLTRAGAHNATLHDRWFQNLHLPHVQLDELRTRLRNRAHALWLWVALDPISKVIPVLHLGSRTQAAAYAVVHHLRQRLAPGRLPVFTSDGLNLYFYALTAHFGQWVDGIGRRARDWQVAAGLLYGQVKKRYRRRQLVGVTYIVRCGTRLALRTTLQGLGLSGRLNTAFVERLNLTLRQSVAALIRRTWSTMQDAPQLLLHLEWWRAYYHFVRPHESLRVALAQPIDRGGKRVPQRYRQRTPAMAAGLTSRRWSVRDLLTLPLPPVPLGAG